ncbi:NHL repeat-containing protein [Streptomyces sp. O3]
MRRRHFVGGLAGTAAGLGLALSPMSQAAAGQRDAADGAWQEVPAPPGEAAAHLIAVAAAGPDLAWAVGEQGRYGGTRGRPIARVWNGTAWSATDVTHLEGIGWIRAVSGVSADAAWAIGTDRDRQDRLLAWDGETWRETDFPGRGEPGTRLTDVAVGPDGQAWISGRHGDRAGLLRGPGPGHGPAWRWCRPLPDEQTPTPTGVHLTPSGEVWVYGDVIARWDGAWTVVPRTLGIRASVTGLLPVAHDDIWLTGFAFGVGGPVGKPPGVTLQHWDGAEWTSGGSPFRAGLLSGITGDAAGRPDLIAGWDFWDQKRTHYLRWDGAGWVSERGPESSGSTSLMNAIAPIPGADGGYWAVGTDTYSAYPPAQIRIERHRDGSGPGAG